MNVDTSNRPPPHLIATSASFRLLGIQAKMALVATPIVDAITARCGACSSSIFLFRRYPACTVHLEGPGEVGRYGHGKIERKTPVKQKRLGSLAVVTT